MRGSASSTWSLFGFAVAGRFGFAIGGRFGVHRLLGGLRSRFRLGGGSSGLGFDGFDDGLIGLFVVLRLGGLVARSQAEPGEHEGGHSELVHVVHQCIGLGARTGAKRCVEVVFTRGLHPRAGPGHPPAVSRDPRPMKIAVLYNRQSKKVINLFGIRSREKYGLASIQRIVAALERGGHQVAAFESDKHLLTHLETFMPRTIAGEEPGIVLNLAYGIQGQARYTHVPGILEMAGLPYVGSDPLGHALALDKVVAKMLFLHHGIPTPEFAVLDDERFEAPSLAYPLIVKPKNEAVSFGLQIVHSEAQLQSAASAIFREYGQAVLVERYIEGREVNVGLLGNGVPMALPVTELLFAEGPRIYTEADKKGKLGQRVTVQSPANIDADLAHQLQQIAQRAFASLGLRDCARVDMRIDDEGRIWVLEINSLPSLGEHGSYTQAAAAAGLDFTALVLRLVDIAHERTFGSSRSASAVPSNLRDDVIARRDHLESRVEHYVALESCADDPHAIGAAAEYLGERLSALGLVPSPRGRPGAWLYESPKTAVGGTLLLVRLDVRPPVDAPPFERTPESLYGSGIATSRAGLAMCEVALEALGERLLDIPLGVLAYTEDSERGPSSAEVIASVAREAAQVFVLHPASVGDRAVRARRGRRDFRLRLEGGSRTLGTPVVGEDPMRRALALVEALYRLGEGDDHSLDIVDIASLRGPDRAAMRVDIAVVITFDSARTGDDLEAAVRQCVREAGDDISLVLRRDVPPLEDRESTHALIEHLEELAQAHQLPFGHRTSAIPSIAGRIAPPTALLCAMGPVAADLGTARESIQRLSLVERTLLLALFLADAPTRCSPNDVSGPRGLGSK